MLENGRGPVCLGSGKWLERWNWKSCTIWTRNVWTALINLIVPWKCREKCLTYWIYRPFFFFFFRQADAYFRLDAIRCGSTWGRWNTFFITVSHLLSIFYLPKQCGTIGTVVVYCTSCLTSSGAHNMWVGGMNAGSWTLSSLPAINVLENAFFTFEKHQLRLWADKIREE